MVIDLSGIRWLRIRYCSCPSPGIPVVQLLRHRLFPETVKSLATVATFHVLKHFQTPNLTAETSGSAFYDTPVPDVIRLPFVPLILSVFVYPSLT